MLLPRFYRDELVEELREENRYRDAAKLCGNGAHESPEHGKPVRPRVALLGAPEATGKVHLEFNGVNVTGPISLKPAASSTPTDVQKPYVHLIAGNQYMCLYAELDGVSVDSIQISPQ